MSGIRALLPESAALPAGFGGQTWIGQGWDEIHCPPMNGAVVFMVRQPRLRRHLADRLPADLPRIDVPTLVGHRTEDPILPIDSTARGLPELMADCNPHRNRRRPHLHGDAEGAADGLCDVVLFISTGPTRGQILRSCGSGFSSSAAMT